MRNYWWLIAATALAAVLLLFVFRVPFLPVKYVPDMTEAAAGVAMALLVVTLFVERSVAVVNALVSGEQQRKAEMDLLTAETGTSALDDLRKVFDDKERLRIFLSFAAGLFISAAGVRTLAGLVTAVPNCTAAAAKAGSCFLSQSQLFFAVDVLLTAGLIAGGSNGLAFLIQRLKDFATEQDPNRPETRTQMMRSRLTTTG